MKLVTLLKWQNYKPLCVTISSMSAESTTAHVRNAVHARFIKYLRYFRVGPICEIVLVAIVTQPSYQTKSMLNH